MATVKSNPFGPVRGRVGPLVFSANGSGDIVRQLVQPSFNLSDSQTQSTNNLKFLAKMWQSLTSDQKSGFNFWAVNGFKPLKSKNVKKYSGFSVFLAYGLALIKGQQNISVPSFVTCGAGATLPYVFIDTPLQLTCIQKNAAGNIQEAGANSYPLKLSNVGGGLGTVPPRINVYDNSNSEISVFFFGVPAPGIQQSQFFDTSGQYFYLKFFFSEKLSYANQPVRNPFRYLVYSTGLCNFSTTGLTNSFGVTVIFPPVPSAILNNLILKVGDNFKLTLVCQDVNGSCISCDSKYFSVQHLPPP